MHRRPIAPQTLNPSDPQGQGSVLKNHESVRQSSARQAMEDFIVLADQNEIEVLVDIHSCSNYVGWRARMEPGWEEHFGFLRDQGFAVVIGEFGGNMDWPNGARQAERDLWSHITPGIDREWQQAFVSYMARENIQACYWAINPESGDTGGWYAHEYDPVSNEAGWGTWLDFDSRKTDLLRQLWGI